MALVWTNRRPAGFLNGAWAGLMSQVQREVDHGRFPLLLPAFAAVGVWAAASVPFDPPLWPLLVSVAALVALRFFCGRFTPTAFLAPVALGAAAVAAGAAALTLEQALVHAPLLTRATTATVEGPIVAAEKKGARQRIVVEVKGGTLEAPAPRRVRLTVGGDEALAVGSTVRVKARLFPLRGPAMPGGYDPSRRLYFDGIGATGYSYGSPEVLAPPRANLRNAIAAMRTGIAKRIEAVGGAGAPLAVALLVGERGGLPEETVEALRVSGLGHILAISGLHMALVAGSVFAAVRFGLAAVPAVALSFPIRKWAALAGLAAATFYLALSGGSVATVRAYVMLVIALVAVLADRPALTMRAVALAATFLIAIDPISVLEPGFQMSFLAVVALVGAYEWWSTRPNKPPRRTKIAAFFIGLAVTSLIAGAATTPAAAYHFHRVAPFGLVANLAAMPILSLAAMPLGVVSLALMPLGLEAVPLRLMGHALTAIVEVAKAVADATGPRGLVGTVPAASAILSAGGLLWLAVLTGPWRLAGAALIGAGLCLLPFAPHPVAIIAPDGKSIAARGGDGRLTVSPGAADFPAAQFLRADADPRTVKEAKTAASCDQVGCILPTANGPLAVPKTTRASAEDCQRARIVVSRGVLRQCGAPIAIDRRALRRHGAHTIYNTASGLQVVTAWPAGRVRAWHVAPAVRRD